MCVKFASTLVLATFNVCSVKMAQNARENRNLSPEECAVAIALVEEGLSQVQVALRLGVTQSTVSRILERFRETNSNQRRPGQGRHRVTTNNQDRFLRLQAIRTRFVTTTSLQQEFSRRYNYRISRDTVRRRLAEVEVTPYRAATGPLLTADHRRQRRQFAQEHQNWGDREWGNVLFSDESRFCRFSDDRRRRVYRRPGERYAQCNIVETVSYGGGSVMVWGGISLEARTELVIIQGGRLTADRYITDILEPHVIPYAPFIGQEFLFMHDNARPHVARVVQDYLQDVEIATLPWPARSPDLNPIEHLWDNLSRSVRALLPPPRDLNELSVRLTEMWDDMDQDTIRNLILSMPRRCEAVIRARGGNTRY